MMPNSAVRSSRQQGLAPPGRRIDRNGNYYWGSSEAVAAASSSCSAATAACCMGDAESGQTTAPVDNDNKYRKRFKQRKQKRLRNGLLGLFVSMCVLVFTYFQIKDDDGRDHVRMARKGERPKHNQQHNEFGRNNNNKKGPKSAAMMKEWEKQWKSHGNYNNNNDRGLNDDHNKDDQHGGDDGRKHEDIGWKAQEKNQGKSWFGGFGGGKGSGRDDEEAVYQRRLLELDYLSERMNSNTNTSIRWADMSDVPPLPGRTNDKSRNKLIDFHKNPRDSHVGHNKQGKFRQFFQIHRPESQPMAWEEEYDAIANKDPTARPDYVDYVHHKYNYPEKLMGPPELGRYPYMRTYKELMLTWPQDNLDNPPDVIQEDLMHFDWNNKADMEAAVKFREAKLPFKVINVPEVMEATKKWTDDYLNNQFDRSGVPNGIRSDGKCNEGPDNFFAFFNVPLWNVPQLGLPPTRDNDWTFERWTKHSHYADRVGLHPHQPHYYWQSGVPREERFEKESQWSFVSKDLPSFSAKEDNFILFHHENQKGIQCRFGERGITAANHYDSGRNMIAMITGAKRYILSPPRACKKLGIVSSKGHASFRHSMLNYGHIALMEDDASEYSKEMPEEEREWLEMTGSAEAVSTVLKEGEILYVPTGWFHYITSLQKSAQCNVRSGPDMDGDEYWGGGYQITADCFPHQ